MKTNNSSSSIKSKKIFSIFIFVFICVIPIFAKISPGDLSKSHTQLEGSENCTKCHTVGSKVSSTKCLECHKEIKKSIATGKGFHASAEVVSRECIVCHTEHYGRDFNIAMIDKEHFDHKKVGFELKGIHAKLNCRVCHNSDFITDPEFKKRASTYMGLNAACLNCHTDYHQAKLSSNCAICHNFDTFKNARTVGFNHYNTEFPLLGKHTNVSCVKCHKTVIVNSKLFQRFKGLQFENCTPCHKDVHKTRFGNNCKQCHGEDSFHSIKNIIAFNHEKTIYQLKGKHKKVACKLCHKTEFMTDPVKHDKCSSCHADYHKGEFLKVGVSPDCNDCHTNNSFTEINFTIKRHNSLKFKLDGAHAATPCTVCHQKQKEWTFAKMPTKCVDCHKNIHKGFISDKYMDNDNCIICHNVNSWKCVTFDHNKTDFKLEGAHARESCAACHFNKNSSGDRIQKFEGLSQECSACHEDSHGGQYTLNGKTRCVKCHGFEDWKDSKFDHNTSRFKLEGAHMKLECEECHKQITNEKGIFIKYKFKDIECTVCHL